MNRAQQLALDQLERHNDDIKAAVKIVKQILSLCETKIVDKDCKSAVITSDILKSFPLTDISKESNLISNKIIDNVAVILRKDGFEVKINYKCSLCNRWCKSDALCSSYEERDRRGFFEQYVQTKCDKNNEAVFLDMEVSWKF